MGNPLQRGHVVELFAVDAVVAPRAGLLVDLSEALLDLGEGMPCLGSRFVNAARTVAGLAAHAFVDRVG